MVAGTQQVNELILPTMRVTHNRVYCGCGGNFQSKMSSIQKHRRSKMHEKWVRRTLEDRQLFVQGLFEGGVRLPPGLMVGENTITLSPQAVGDVVRWSGTQAAAALGDVGMNVTTGRPSAFIGGSARDLLGAHEIIQPDGSVTYTADQPMGSNKITGLADGTNPNDAVNKSQLDGVSAGLNWKDSVRAATTGAGVLATDFENLDVIDGVTLATGDRILIKNQGAGAENGIYTVNASGAPTRATDADTGSEILQAAMFVEEGTTNADTMWVLTNNDPINLGTDALTFTQFGVGGGGESLAATLAIGNTTGGTDIVVSAGDDIQMSAGATIIFTPGANQVSIDEVAQGGINVAEIPNLGAGVTDQFVFEDVAQVLTQKTLTQPTIGDFTNATHNHQAPAGGGQLDHGAALTGLTDDDHTQYLLLAGRAGGQVAQGGTGAGDDLTLESTANGTKGFVIIQTGSHLEPGSSNSTDIGATTPFRKIKGLEVESGDLVFANQWRMTETWEDGSIGYQGKDLGKKTTGMLLFDEDGEEMFAIRKDGLFFRGKKIAS